MTFINLPNVGTLTLDAASLLQAHPTLLQQIVGDKLMHSLQKYLGRIRGRHGMSRRMMRKSRNRKRRRFVDNIIMHHKRLHDHNRAIVVSNARSRALAKRSALKQDHLEYALTPEQIHKRSEEKSYHASSFSERVNTMRGRVDARRLRTRSRWLSVMGDEVDG